MAERKSNIFYFAASIALISIVFSTYGLWEGIELKTYDLRLKLMNRLGISGGTPSGKVVVVAMEEEKLIKEKPLIFWYPDIGRFLSKIKNSGASAIGIDLIAVHALGEKMKEAIGSLDDSPPGDPQRITLEEMGGKADNALLGPLLEVSREMPVIQGVAEGIVPYYYGLMGFMKNVRPASVRFTVDKDQIIRRQALMFDKEPSFPFAIYDTSGGRKSTGGDFVYIDYGSIKNVEYVAFDEFMKRDSNPGLKGKFILLGYVTSYDDFHSTPFGRFPGVMIHAATMETLLSGRGFKKAPFYIEALFIAALMAASLLITSKFGPFPATISVSSFAVFYLLFNLFMFSRGVILAMFPGVLAPFFAFFSIYPYKYIVEEMTKRRIYKTFSYYMDKRVIDSLISRDPESLLRGEEMDVCILFLDIRDFTGMSYNKKPDVIIRFLNGYFGIITEIIQRNDGFVNKFIGDAVLAFFAGDKAVSNALKAAGQLIYHTRSMNADGSARLLSGDKNLDIGIGIHYGRVIMGNIGSMKKMDFTIIGDSVNITSRIEKLTKTLKRPVLISGDAASKAGPDFNLEFLGEHNVRGVDKSISVYALKGVY